MNVAMNDVVFIVNGVLFAAALWVGFSSIKRLNMMHWREHEPLVIVAYIAIALWAASYLLGIAELQPFGIVGVAVLFLAGRKRWLVEAPRETRLSQQLPKEI